MVMPEGGLRDLISDIAKVQKIFESYSFWTTFL